jgi:hypothetical protein
MAYLYDVIVNAQQDKRTDARSYNSSNSTSITYAPIYAYDSTVSGNKNSAESTSRADWEQSNSDGFTGKNAQNTLIAVGVVAVLCGVGYIGIKSYIK